MSNTNYTRCTNEELLGILRSFNIHIGRLNAFCKLHYPELYKELINRTSFLEDNISIAARLYCLKNNITKHPNVKTKRIQTCRKNMDVIIQCKTRKYVII